MSTTTTIGFIVAFTANRVYAGRLGESMNQIGSTGLSGTDVESITLNDITGRSKVWAVDGTDSIEVDVGAGTVNAWTASAGTVPAGCALVAAYRGRAVLARQLTNPSIWYASRVLNPEDWDFGASPVAESAVAGTNAQIGQPTDAIMALMTAGQDYLIFGCQSSLWALIGDPGYGGQVLNISNRTGVLGPRAWCFDENDILYFMGNGGLYRLAGPTEKPMIVGGNRLKTYLDRVDPDVTLIQLVYEDLRKEVHIFMTPRDQSQGTHVVYDIVHDAFWLDQYPTTFGPNAACPIAGPDDEDRRYVIGGFDGYIRRPNDTEKSDDGTAINSYVDLGCWEIAGEDCLASELQAYPFAGTGAVSFEWYVGKSSDVVRQMSSSPETSGTLFAASDTPDLVGVRVRGAAHKVRIKQNSATLGWSAERFAVEMEPAGRRR